MRRLKQIVFLGAGASAADGAPVQSTLFSQYFNSAQVEADQHLRGFFKDFYGIDVLQQLNGNEFPTFEELLGILEIALLRGESFKGYSITPSAPQVQKMREDLIFLIAKILKEKLQYFERTNHDQLITRLQSELLLKNTTFISLNYDILIDNSLTDIHDILDLDYGVNFTNFERKNDWHAPRKNRSVQLLKLHGSLNWLYCQTCTSITITPKEKSVSTIADRPVSCRKCRTHTVPIIIPPTFFKAMSNFYLQQIWQEAEKKLAYCDRIIFCGYSFPDADVHIKYLLKRMEVNNNKSPDVYIFNNHHGKDAAMLADEERRYKTFFRSKAQVTFTNRSFEDFCRNDI